VIRMSALAVELTDVLEDLIDAAGNKILGTLNPKDKNDFY